MNKIHYTEIKGEREREIVLENLSTTCIEFGCEISYVLQ